MTFRRRQILGWLGIGLAMSAGVGWLVSLDFTRKISTDVLDLIPAGESAPELALVRQMASQSEARVMLFALARLDGGPVSEDEAARFAAALAADPAFDQAQVMGDSSLSESLGRTLLEQRFTLLFPKWLAEMRRRHAAVDPEDFETLVAGNAAEALELFLSMPEAVAFQELVPADPLLLLPSALGRMSSGMAWMQATQADADLPSLVWARLAASPLSEEGQAPAFLAIERAAAALKAGVDGVTVSYTGVNRFAAASRTRIEGELAFLNLLSLVAVLGVTFTLVRSIYRVLHLLPVMFMAVLGAWTFVTLGFERVHVLVFVVGSLLTGVAIDYGFYLFMQPAAFAGEDYWAKVRRLLKPMLASCFTAVAGFSLLIFSELPLIRQLGVFIAAGLLCGFVSALVYFSTVRIPFLEARPFARAGLARGKWSPMIRRVLLIAWIAALPGLAFIEWRDDIRELEIPSPSLKAEDARIRGLFGQRGDGAVFLSYGATPAEARDAMARLETWLSDESGENIRTIGLGPLVPTSAENAQAVGFIRDHPNFPHTLRDALEERGFDAAEFAPFFSAYSVAARDASEENLSLALGALRGGLEGPLGLLMSTGGRWSWFATIASKAPVGAVPPGINSIGTNQLESLNHVFGTYRQSALRLSLIGLALVGAGVLATYGFRDGVRIFAIPCGACLGVFGLFGWMGHPLNMFHLVGAFLGVCLTHNFAIFTATSAYRREPPPVSVRMSALTTAASFGVLALSGIPVVRALGMTVGVMVIAALLVIEFEHLAGLGKNEK